MKIPEAFRGIAALIGLVLIVGLVVAVVTGCGNLAAARIASDATMRTVGYVAPMLHEDCTVPTQEAVAQARSMPEGRAREDFARAAINRLEAQNCPRFANAYEGAFTASMNFDAVVTTAETGQCVGVSPSADDCNVPGAMAKALAALAATSAACPKSEPRCKALQSMVEAVKAAAKATQQ